MNTVQEYIAHRQAKFAQHPFFDRIAKCESLDELVPVAQHMSFFVMSFQDMLRLNEARMINSKLRKIVRHHLVEDLGHDQWFLSDLKAMNIEEPSIQFLYNRDYTYTRDASYTLMAEVFRARNDYERVALVLTFESTGHVLFKYIGDFVQRFNYTSILKYYSNHHLEVEKNHQIFEQQMEAYLDSIQLTQEEEKNIIDIVNRAYEAFILMFDGLNLVLKRQNKVRVSSTS